MELIFNLHLKNFFGNYSLLTIMNPSDTKRHKFVFNCLHVERVNKTDWENWVDVCANVDLTRLT